jgi:hypothetical protein
MGKWVKDGVLGPSLSHWKLFGSFCQHWETLTSMAEGQQGLLGTACWHSSSSLAVLLNCSDLVIVRGSQQFIEISFFPSACHPFCFLHKTVCIPVILKTYIVRHLTKPDDFRWPTCQQCGKDKNKTNLSKLLGNSVDF